MALIDDIRKSISEIGFDPETIVRRSEDAMRLQKAKLQLSVLEKDLEQQYAQIGRLYLEMLGDGEIPGQMKPVADRIRACRAAIEETQQRISGSK